ncbi:MAG: hypothetical protein M3380_04430 [Chloroflexota bacterium]|nr:hypothetical protein [Chloroflexota bacterium]
MSTSIGKELRTKLRDAVGREHTTVDASGDEAHVAVDVEHCERYAVGVRGLQVTPTEPVADVQGAAERIVEHVDTIERLRVVEFDAPEGQAILRSAEPESDEAGVTYWEATVKPDETTLHRFHKSHLEPDREVVVEPITHQQVGELADQLVDALTGDGA